MDRVTKFVGRNKACCVDFHPPGLMTGTTKAFRCWLRKHPLISAHTVQVLLDRNIRDANALMRLKESDLSDLNLIFGQQIRMRNMIRSMRKKKRKIRGLKDGTLRKKIRTYSSSNQTEWYLPSMKFGTSFQRDAIGGDEPKTCSCENLIISIETMVNNLAERYHDVQENRPPGERDYSFLNDFIERMQSIHVLPLIDEQPSQTELLLHLQNSYIFITAACFGFEDLDSMISHLPRLSRNATGPPLNERVAARLTHHKESCVVHALGDEWSDKMTKVILDIMATLRRKARTMRRRNHRAEMICEVGLDTDAFEEYLRNIDRKLALDEESEQAKLAAEHKDKGSVSNKQEDKGSVSGTEEDKRAARAKRRAKKFSKRRRRRLYVKRELSDKGTQTYVLPKKFIYRKEQKVKVSDAHHELCEKRPKSSQKSDASSKVVQEKSVPSTQTQEAGGSGEVDQKHKVKESDAHHEKCPKSNQKSDPSSKAVQESDAPSTQTQEAGGSGEVDQKQKVKQSGKAAQVAECAEPMDVDGVNKQHQDEGTGAILQSAKGSGESSQGDWVTEAKNPDEHSQEDKGSDVHQQEAKESDPVPFNQDDNGPDVRQPMDKLNLEDKGSNKHNQEAKESDAGNHEDMGPSDHRPVGEGSSPDKKEEAMESDSVAFNHEDKDSSVQQHVDRGSGADKQEEAMETDKVAIDSEDKGPSVHQPVDGGSGTGKQEEAMEMDKVAINNEDKGSSVQQPVDGGSSEDKEEEAPLVVLDKGMIKEAWEKLKILMKDRFRRALNDDEEVEDIRYLCHDCFGDDTFIKPLELGCLKITLKFPCLLNLFKFQASVRSGYFGREFEPLFLTDHMKEIAEKVGIPLKLIAEYDEERFKDCENYFIRRDGSSPRPYKIDSDVEHFDNFSLVDNELICDSDTNDEDEIVQSEDFTTGEKVILVLEVDANHEFEDYILDIPPYFKAEDHRIHEGASLNVVMQLLVTMTPELEHRLHKRTRVMGLLGIRRYIITHTTDFKRKVKRFLKQFGKMRNVTPLNFRNRNPKFSLKGVLPIEIGIRKEQVRLYAKSIIGLPEKVPDSRKPKRKFTPVFKTEEDEEEKKDELETEETEAGIGEENMEVGSDGFDSSIAKMGFGDGKVTVASGMEQEAGETEEMPGGLFFSSPPRSPTGDAKSLVAATDARSSTSDAKDEQSDVTTPMPSDANKRDECLDSSSPSVSKDEEASTSYQATTTAPESPKPSESDQPDEKMAVSPASSHHGDGEEVVRDDVFFLKCRIFSDVSIRLLHFHWVNYKKPERPKPPEEVYKPKKVPKRLNRDPNEKASDTDSLFEYQVKPKRRRRRKRRNEPDSPPPPRPPTPPYMFMGEQKEGPGAVFVFDTWDEDECGLPGFHRDLVRDFCRRKPEIIRVFCTVIDVKRTEKQKLDAADTNMTLLIPRRLSRFDYIPDPALPRWLLCFQSYFPVIEKLENIKYVVGYNPESGYAATNMREKAFKDAKLILINHLHPEDPTLLIDDKERICLMEQMMEVVRYADVMISLGPRMKKYFDEVYKTADPAVNVKHIEMLPKPCEKYFERQVTAPTVGQNVLLSYANELDDLESLEPWDKLTATVGEFANAWKEESGSYPAWNILRVLPENEAEIVTHLEETIDCPDVVPIIHPCVTSEQLAEQHQEANLCVIPSCHTEWPFHGLEAVAHGIPTVVDEDSLMADLITAYFPGHEETCVVRSPRETLTGKMMMMLQDLSGAFLRAKNLKDAYRDSEEVEKGYAAFADLFDVEPTKPEDTEDQETSQKQESEDRESSQKQESQPDNSEETKTSQTKETGEITVSQDSRNAETTQTQEAEMSESQDSDSEESEESESESHDLDALIITQ